MENNINELEKSLNNIILELKDAKMISTKNLSDKWHTFGDLYDHRMAFTIALCNAIDIINKLAPKAAGEWCDSWSPDVYCYKSKRHHDNENDPMFEGSFIVVIESPGGQISYHYNLEHWDKFKIEEKEEANLYDGHTPADTIVRLTNLF